MRKAVLALAGAAALAMSSAASATVVIDFNNPSGPLGTSQVYSNSGLSVTAYGVTGTLAPINLYGKNFGGDESGVGVVTDPSGDNEIWGLVGGAIILDVSQLLASNVSAAQFFMGSTTGLESWNVYEWNGSSFVLALSGNNELVWNDLPDWGSTTEYAFTAGGWGQNVLLGGLSLTTASVPEPSTWAMMLLGFGAVGFALRRKRKPALLQIA